MKFFFTCCVVCLPLQSIRLSSLYGFRNHPLTRHYAFHAGVDLRARHDTVFAIMDAKVLDVSYNETYGIFISLDHGELRSSYGHLSQVFVRNEEEILAGEAIGVTGATGRVTGEHLHLAVRYRNQYINPVKFLYQILIKQHHE